MSEGTQDTIFALSSGRPPAAIAVVRISGSRAGAALTALGVRIPPPRKAGLARVRDPVSRELIDEALVLWFPGPASETGEDVAELQLHGGRAVIAAVLAALGGIEGLRMAEPGEFTRRGFENGKLDLTAVEGLADLVMAETEGQRRQAFRQMKGALGSRADAWRQTLIRALALVEARIDFSDEADVPENLVEPALALARGLADEIEAALADGRRGERLREGLVVAIAGPPNAGKSTLLNRIARRDAAIVSPHAGTTRDVIEVHLDLDGWPVTLLDTAGIRPTDDPVELEGVRRAQARAADADLVLWVADAEAAEAAVPAFTGQSPEAPPGAAVPPIWRVRNKIDLLKQNPARTEYKVSPRTKDRLSAGLNRSLRKTVNDPSPPKTEYRFNDNEITFSLSALTGEGIDRLLQALMREAESMLAGGPSALVTRERHRRLLNDTLSALRRALAPELVGREDLLAEELRAAAQALGRLTGRLDVEDVLGLIFSEFCIGK